MTRLGGGNLWKLERGENFEFPAAPKINPFLQRFDWKSPIGGSKVQVFEGQLSGGVPRSPLQRSARFEPPPYPGIRSGHFFPQSEEENSYDKIREKSF